MPTKKYHKKKDALASVIAERLELLRVERNLNYTEFAKFAGVPWSQYNSWRNSGSVPGGKYLKLLAERLGVSVDWLVGVTDAQRSSVEVVVGELPSEVAKYVARETRLHAANKPWGAGVKTFAVDGQRVLDLVVGGQLEKLENEWAEVAKHAVREENQFFRVLALPNAPKPEDEADRLFWIDRAIEDLLDGSYWGLRREAVENHPEIHRVAALLKRARSQSGWKSAQKKGREKYGKRMADTADERNRAVEAAKVILGYKEGEAGSGWAEKYLRKLGSR